MKDLFSDIKEVRGNSVDNSEVLYKDASSILAEGKGFLDGYDFILNPYSGCSFGYIYCYAAFIPHSEEQRNNGYIGFR